MVKNKILDAKDLLEKLEKIRKRYMKENDKKGIPYFKKIIEKLKEIKSFSDISNVMKIISEDQKKCGSNRKYENKEINPILSLFTTTLNFLKYQEDGLKFKKDFETIDSYDLSKVRLTKEDELSLSSSTSNSTLEKLEVVNSASNSTFKKQEDILKSFQRFEKEKWISDKEYLSKFKRISILKKQLKKIKEEKQIIIKKIRFIHSNIKLLLEKEIKTARNWWHWPLKFFTCGMWESKEIRKINKDYKSGQFGKKLIDDISKKLEQLNCQIEEITKEIYVLNASLKDDIKVKRLISNDKCLSSSINNLDNNSTPSLNLSRKVDNKSNLLLNFIK